VCLWVRSGEVILRDDGFGFSEKLGRLGQMLSGRDGSRIWDVGCRAKG